MAIALLPSPPQRTDSPDVFVTKSDAFVAALPGLVSDINTTAANLNSVAAGGATAIPFKFSTGTAVSNPGPNYVRLDNANVASATTMMVSGTSAANLAVVQYVNQMGQSTSTVKGQIRLASLDGSRYAVYNITNVTQITDSSTWNQISISLASSPGSTNYFVNNETLMMFFTRSGDKGDVGPSGSAGLVLLNSTSVSATVGYVDFASLFTSTYDKYIVDFAVRFTAAGIPYLQVAKAGSVDTGGNYSFGNSTGNSTSQSSSSMLLGPNATNAIGTVTIWNANDANSFSKSFHSQCYGYNAANTPPTSANDYAGMYNLSGVLSGCRFGCSGSTIASGLIRVYGVKTS